MKIPKKQGSTSVDLLIVTQHSSFAFPQDPWKPQTFQRPDRDIHIFARYNSMGIPFLFSLIFYFFPGDPVKVDPLIYRDLNRNQTADVLCVFKTKHIDLGSITRQFETKSQKGNYVYQQLQSEAKTKQSKIIQYLTRHQIEFYSLYILNAIHIPLANAEVIEYLSSQQEISRLEYNTPFVLIKPANTPVDLTPLESRDPNAIEWGIVRIGADSLWQLGIKGQGTVLGGEDTGVELHPAIKNSYRGTLADQSLNHNYNWHDAIHTLNPIHMDSTNNPNNNPCGLDVTVPCDDHNHGTHTVGTMAATDFQTGVAPEAKWIACRCMERGWGSLATYLECFQWFLAPADLNNNSPDPQKAPHVINNSWGCPPEEGCNPFNFITMDQVIKNLKAAGIFVTVSAGNSGSTGCSSIDDPPATLEPSFTVGATAINDTIASFSSKGPVTVDQSGRLKPNISAPGVAVRSTIKNGGFATWNGTSMASPHVSGTVALLISAFPSLAGKVELLEDILEKSADPKTISFTCGLNNSDMVPNIVYGYGRLNAYRAYLYAKQLLTTGTTHETVLSIHVFPNPFDHQVVFDFGKNILIKRLVVYDINGRIVYHQPEDTKSSIRIHTRSWSQGIYFYRVETSSGIGQGKVILVR